MILSLFDGIACGMMACLDAGIPVDRYVAYEIDKYAIQTALFNYPQIEEKGDVFKADFTGYKGKVKYLIGGSPCTYWSVAQTKNRETTASGLGWELFCQYVRALKESEPEFFLYENNKSMSKEIRQSISDTFGFEPVCINSALVSAQNRQRLYWVGKRNADGTYSKVNVEQPEDKGILLKDILEVGCPMRDKAPTIDANYYKGGNLSNLKKQSGARLLAAEPVVALPVFINTTKDNKAQCVRATCYKDGIRNVVANNVDRRTGVAVPVYNAVSKTKKNNITRPVRIGNYPRLDGTVSNSQGYRIYSMEGKSITQSTNGGGIGAKTGLYAVPCDSIYYAEACEWNEDGEPINAVSCSDNKTHTVYKVTNGMITVKGKTYPIKLEDGYYIIRVLSVRECARLQTIPETYKFPCSDAQSKKQIGNGWTISCISHILKATLK